MNFDSTDTVAGVGTQAGVLEHRDRISHSMARRASDMDANGYITDAVVRPLAMDNTDVRGSPAYGIHSTADDLAVFMAEVLHLTW